MAEVDSRVPDIIVAPYSPLWPQHYDREAGALRRTLGAQLAEIHHVGSTAVVGLPAKPLIDVLAGMRELLPAEAYLESLDTLGYVYEDVGDAGRHFFRRGSPRSHHLHLTQVGSFHYWRMILFRDRLRIDADVAQRYQNHKLLMADRFANDRAAYTNSKTDFINGIVLEELEVRPALCAKLKAQGWALLA